MKEENHTAGESSAGADAGGDQPEELGGWTENDWQGLLLYIRHGRCTPFLGAGASDPVLPLGGDVAEIWAREHKYPFPDKRNLPRVAQYVDVAMGKSTSKLLLTDMFAGLGEPDFGDLNEPHRVMADLGLPVYITTNYDDFMASAIERGTTPRTPQRVFCKWYMEPDASVAAQYDAITATPESPVVFHLHGTLKVLESMVLTEDDYLDFLMNSSIEPKIIPSRIERAFTETSLLFMGYSLEDMNFKVLFRRITAYMKRSTITNHVSVQLAPVPGETIDEQIERAKDQKEYLERRFNLQGIKIYWGSCSKFARELRKRL